VKFKVAQNSKLVEFWSSVRRKSVIRNFLKCNSRYEVIKLQKL